MSDFSIVDVPGMLGRKVTSYDEDGSKIPDDGEWHRHTAVTQYVFAEFLVENGLVEGVSAVDRRPDLVVRWSQLSPIGQAFVKAAYDKWLRSIDRIGTTEADMRQKLERRWRKFTEANAA